MSLLRLKTVFIILASDAFISGVISASCFKEDIYFGPKNGVDIDCEIITGAKKHSRAGYCVFTTCADLKDHSDDWFCCSEEGCIEGCIEFDQDLLLANQTEPTYEEAFEKRFGHLVRVLSKAEANDAAAWGSAVHSGRG